MKRLLPALMSLCLCLCLLPLPAAEAAGGVTVDAAHFPDDNFRAYVAEHLDADGNGILSDGERAVKLLNVSDLGIRSLRGVEYFPALEFLACSGNQLTTLDISRNKALTRLSCTNNALAALDVSGNAALATLECAGNALTSLDVRSNPALKWLACMV